MERSRLQRFDQSSRVAGELIDPVATHFIPAAGLPDVAVVERVDPVSLGERRDLQVPASPRRAQAVDHQHGCAGGGSGNIPDDVEVSDACRRHDPTPLTTTYVQRGTPPGIVPGGALFLNSTSHRAPSEWAWPLSQNRAERSRSRSSHRQATV